MSGQTDFDSANDKLVTAGGFSALGASVRLRISDGTRFIFGLPNVAVKETDLVREEKNGAPTDVLRWAGEAVTCSGDAGSAILHSAWLVGSKGAVCALISDDPRHPVVAGNGNEVVLEALRWMLPA